MTAFILLFASLVQAPVIPRTDSPPARAVGIIPDGPTRQTVLVVVGADGSEEYGKQFREWSERWKQAADKGQAEFVAIGLNAEEKTPDRDLLKQRLEALASGKESLWLILIGHGTFNGKVARFNLRGPDVSLAELSEWLRPMERPLAIVNCASSSGPFLNELSGPGRVVLVSTKSGHEYNFTRFGDYLSSAIADPQADLDKDHQTSLLEAYLKAAAGVREFYEADGRLMTEHALLDDNGDRMGTPPDWFQGVRATKAAKDGATVDGQRASQWNLVRSPQEHELPPKVRERRDRIERDLAQLRLQKSKLSEEEYLAKIEPLMLELAEIYAAVEVSN